MNLGELCQDVYTLTKRPDLEAQTQLAVRQATLRFHLMDFFQRDLVERQVTFAEAATSFGISIPGNFDNFRKFKYFRVYDPVSGEVGKYITALDPTNIFDEFGRHKADIYYMAGQQLNIKTGEAQVAFMAAWYKFPNVSTAAYSSWIADMVPFAIIDAAAGKIHRDIGNVEESNKYLAPETGTVERIWIPAIKANEIELEAR